MMSVFIGSTALLIHRRRRLVPVKIAIMGLVLVMALGSTVQAQDDQIPIDQQSLQSDMPDLSIFNVDKNDDASIITFGVINEGSVPALPFTISLYVKNDSGVFEQVATTTGNENLDPAETYHGEFSDYDWKWIWPKSEFEVRLDEGGLLPDNNQENNVKAKSWTYLELIPLRIGYYISFVLIPIL
ncbi:MAG: hypothetical protein GY869_15105, partial [Planctomycetes bacterium]|nr:hypothetical protein [Planctomycetota bacterium]